MEMSSRQLIHYASTIDKVSCIIESFAKQQGFPDAYNEDLGKLEEIERWLLDLAADEMRKENTGK